MKYLGEINSMGMSCNFCLDKRDKVYHVQGITLVIRICKKCLTTLNNDIKKANKPDRPKR